MNATQLEKFCREHDIQWSYEMDQYGNCRFEFYHFPSDSKYTTRFGPHEHVSENVLIRTLINVFDLGGEKEMKHVETTTDTIRELAAHIKSYCENDICHGDYLRVGLGIHQACEEWLYDMSAIEKVIFNDPATIVIWADGTKTIVKADREKFDPEKGLAMAIAKKFLGNQGNYYEVFKKWLPEEKENLPINNEKLERVDGKLDAVNKYLNTSEQDIPTTYLTAAELAEKLGLSVETVRKDCRAGLHPGAVKVDGKWQIPY